MPLPDRSTPLFLLLLSAFLAGFLGSHTPTPKAPPCTPLTSHRWQVKCIENAPPSSLSLQKKLQNPLQLGARAWLFQQPMNLNSARRHEMRLLPGLGQNAVQRIFAHRAKYGPFQSVASLVKVKGIGKKTLKKLAPLLTVEAPMPNSQL